jgi:SPP1 gp7 family putative phage head morphogenesis protein
MNRLFRLTPAEAVRYLQGRGQLAETFSWQDLWQEEHAHQFTVSRLARLDLLAAVQEAITQSVEGDLTRRDWMRDMTALFKREGWWGEKEVVDPETGETLTTKFDAPRLKLIFDTNTRMANAAGHWQQAVAGRQTHPYLRYVTKRDARVRKIHQGWDNLTLPIDDPFWRTRYPPNGWRCRCRVVSVSRADHARLNAVGRIKTEAPPMIEQKFINRRTGEITRLPAGVDPGFAYNPGVTAQREAALARLVETKLAAVSQPLAEAAIRDRMSATRDQEK